MTLSHGFCKYVSLYLISSPTTENGQAHPSWHDAESCLSSHAVWWREVMKEIWLSRTPVKTPVFFLHCLCVQTRESRYGGLNGTFCFGNGRKCIFAFNSSNLHYVSLV